MATCERDALLSSARCFVDLPLNQQNAIIIQLLCNISGQNPTPQLIYDGGTAVPAGWTATFGTYTYDGQKVYLAGPVTSMDTQHDDLLDGTIDVSAFAPTLERFYPYGNSALTINNLGSLYNLKVFSASYILSASRDLTGLSNLEECDVAFNTSLTSLDLTPVPKLNNLAFTNCTSLTSIDITPCPLLTQVYGIDCNLDLASVNGILVALDNAGLHDGILRINGGTSPIPTGAGLTAKANLIAKGWEATTNN